MPPTVYVETTIFSYLTARATTNVVAAGRQAVTRTWWSTRRGAFTLFVSELVLEEAADGDPEAAERRLAEARPLPLVNVTGPALALAAVHGIDYLLTWNLRHIANAELRPRLDGACRARGYRPPILCTPDELMGALNDGGDRER